MEDPKTTVRRHRPAAYAMPTEIRESMPPQVRWWRVFDGATGTDHGDPLGEGGRTEESAWVAAAVALNPRQA